MFKLTKDSKLTGYISGLVAPIIFILLFWATVLANRMPNLTLTGIINQNLAAPLLGLGQIANAAIFFLFIKKWEADESSKGVILAMLTYGALIVYLKLASGSLF